MCVCVCVRAHVQLMPWPACGCQRTDLKSWFSSYIVGSRRSNSGCQVYVTSTELFCWPQTENIS